MNLFFSNNYPDYAYELMNIISKNVKCQTRIHVCGDATQIIPDLIDLPIDILSLEFKAKPKLIESFKEYENNKKKNMPWLCKI